MGADPDAAPPRPSAEFDAWAAEAVSAGDLDALIDFQRVAPAAREAHPRTEHWAPLYVALGAAEASGLDATSVVDGFLVRALEAVLAVQLSPSALRQGQGTGRS